MKKFILIITLILTFFSFNYEVRADTVIFTIDRSYMDSHLNKDYIDRAYELIKEYDYKYYVIEYSPFIDSIRLYLTNSDVVSVNQTLDNIEVRQFRNVECVINSSSPDGSCTYYSSIENNNYLMNLYSSSYEYYGYYDSNIDIFSNSPVEFTGFYDDNIEVLQAEKFPKLKDLLNYDSWSDYETENNPNYTTINLNDYAYIALFLKDYSNTKAFSSTTYVKGQSCVTPVYNFSTSLKPNKSENICTPVYEDYTKSDIFILESDIKNNAVYYVSAYNKDIENFIKIDNTVFDIFYVSEEDAKNPTFNYNGKEYNGIALDDIDYSANNNTENGVVPGESQNFGDFADDVISKPIDFFKSIASAITSFFGLITSFLSFLPVELQSFLYFAFVIAIVLGILKILL